VIKCLRVHLEQRCLERGYEFDSVRECIVSEDGDELVVDENHPKYPRKGIGDLVAGGLKAVGITPERVGRLTGKPCNCNKRRKVLNSIGRKMGLN
jgi:hypothetical protein